MITSGVCVLVTCVVCFLQAELMGPPLPVPLRFLSRKCTAYQVTNILILLQQAMTALPGTLLLSFSAWLAISQQQWLEPCNIQFDQSSDVFSGASWLYQLGLRVMTYYVVYALASVGWVAAVSNMQPAMYLRLSTCSTWVSMVAVLSAMYWTEALTAVLVVAAALAPSGSCSLSLGCLGEDLEVSEVGRTFLLSTD